MEVLTGEQLLQSSKYFQDTARRERPSDCRRLLPWFSCVPMSRIRTLVGRLSEGRMLIRLPIEGALLGSNVLVVNKVVTQDANCTRD